MELIVSLPRNDVELARAAASAGADALKVHMNVHHDASGTHFGSFAEEADTVRGIINTVDCPVGLMPGASVKSLPTVDELTALHADGLRFLDIYAHNMPLWFLGLPLKLIVALGSSGMGESLSHFTKCLSPSLANTNCIYMCEASIFPPEEYGTPFTHADYCRMRALQDSIEVPLLIPTQKAITPEDARWLKTAGIGGLMIGAIVTGTTADSIARATALYRAAIDAVDEP